MWYALIAVLVFVSAAALDYATARYFDAVRDRARHQAASWSVVMGALGLVGMAPAFEISYLYALPQFAGLYIGTLLAIPKDPHG